jgi:hypothetical protein
MISNRGLGKGFGLNASLELDKNPECQPTGSRSEVVAEAVQEDVNNDLAIV